MATKQKQIATFDGQDLAEKLPNGTYAVKSQGWIVPPLGPKSLAALAAAKAAVKAWEDAFKEHVIATRKINENKYAIQFGFRFEPSYRIVDKACVAKSRSAGTGSTVEFNLDVAA